MLFLLGLIVRSLFRLLVSPRAKPGNSRRSSTYGKEFPARRARSRLRHDADQDEPVFS
jgi:hypothetical protein